MENAKHMVEMENAIVSKKSMSTVWFHAFSFRLGEENGSKSVGIDDFRGQHKCGEKTLLGKYLYTYVPKSVRFDDWFGISIP